RLEQRGQDSEEVIARRLEEASIEISHYNEYDYLVINDEFDAAKRDLKSIFQAHRLKTSTQSKRNHVLLEGLL
ncbi:MAG: guanylate kinase, partial [Gammaproteobacteria bacterium]|nr:guanylate kinase [Gammaproteobacteria bacterium]